MIRDYIYVEDAARMIATIAGAVPKFPLYNIGSDVGHSVNEVLTILGDVTELVFSVEDLSTPPTS